MPTGDKYLNIVTKRIVGTDDFGTRFLEYLRSRIEEMNRQQYEAAFFHPNGVAITAAGNDKFDLEQDTVDGNAIASDGLGNFLDFENSVYENVEFENQSSIDYYIALKHTTVPDGIQINPRTGYPEWIAWEDQIGEKGDPDSATDNGNGTITFVIDGITESSVDHSGRIATVYLKSPASGATTEAIAKEECTVVYSGGENKITTTGDLGQTTISETETLYSVVIKGPTVRRNTDLRTEDGYCYIGYVTGAGAGNPPTVFNTDDQKIIDHSWTEILVNGLGQDFYPDTDDTYSLGTASKRWSAIYTTNLDLSGDFLPATSNSQDIGSSSLLWKDGYFISLNSGHILPRLDDTFNLGSGSFKWSYLYSQNISCNNRVSTNELSVASQGVASDLIPDTNNTHDLGASSYRWDNLYVNNLDVTDFGSDLLPDTNNAYDVGSATYRWQNIYCGKLNVSTTAGEGISSDLIPDTDNTHQLGAVSYHWLRIYTDYLYVRSGAGGGVQSNLQPSVNSTYNLGDPSYQWSNIYSSGTLSCNKIDLSALGGNGFSSNIVPDTNNAYDIGGSSYKFKDLYLQGNLVVGGISSDLIPDTNNEYDLGSTSYKWKDLKVAGTITAENITSNGIATFSVTGDEGIGSHFYPDTDESYNIGNGSYRWLTIYSRYLRTDELTFETGAGNGLASDMFPKTTNTYDLGDSTYYWGNIYSNNIYYKTTFTTFDDEDDLALVENYGPTDKKIEIIKKGEKRIVRTANPNSMPWPMVGKQDGDNCFIHAGDSITFLLGAIKQLYNKHKDLLKKVEMLKSTN
jgi:hypothetical protein